MSDAGAQQDSRRWLWLAVVVVIADQGTKVIAEQLLVAHDPVAVLPFFNFYLTYNCDCTIHCS